ncbi:MAG: hypothetical protein JNL79_38895 [Myxococcales bacterium]|nr:hypothetical protein [Myxococcales bacterium]
MRWLVTIVLVVAGCRSEEGMAADAPCIEGTQGACYTDTCCRMTFTVCQQCQWGEWRWPVDDNCHFACPPDAGRPDTAVDASDADGAAAEANVDADVEADVEAGSTPDDGAGDTG